MSNLIYKELRLAAHPNLYVFTLLGILVIVPAYPYGMVFMFGCLAPYITFTYGRETGDIYYSVLLPADKRGIARAKCLTVMLAQIAQLLFSLPFAVLRVHILPEGNPAGIEANAAYYGFGLMIYALFNIVFLPGFFKTGHKTGIPFLMAIVPSILAVTAMEISAQLPQLRMLDSTAPADLIRQAPILAAGMLIYALCSWLACGISEARFARVDL